MPASPDDRVFDLAAELFGLLSTPTRLRIVCALIDGEHNVSELLEQVAVSQPNMSQHLGTLYRGGVLARRRTGTQIYYRVEHAEARRLCEALMRRAPFAAVGLMP
jgi:DNA-binding transcriptional ArsR family regulator